MSLFSLIEAILNFRFPLVAIICHGTDVRVVLHGGDKSLRPAFNLERLLPKDPANKLGWLVIVPFCEDYFPRSCGIEISLSLCS